MTVTKKAIRQAVAALMPEAYVGTATTTSTTSTLYDEDEEVLSFVADGGRDFTGYWIVRADAVTSTDRVRRVANHDPGTGALVPSRGWANQPDGETYELWPPHLRPALIDNAIDTGLKRLAYKVTESITPTANDNSYSLASYTWITSERSVREVYMVYTTSNVVIRQEYPWWKVNEDSGAFTLLLDPVPSGSSGVTVELTGIGHYTALATDATTTSCPTDWAVAAAFVETLRYLLRTQKGFNAEAWKTDYMEAKKTLFRLSKMYMPVATRRVMPRSPMQMPSIGSRGSSRGYLY